MFIKKWLLAALGLPLAYIILPVSCCVRNPAAKVYDEDCSSHEHIPSFMENVGVGMLGAITTFTCCCCCNCAKDPKDM